MLKQFAPVFCLFVITPLIAEYLLGNVPMNWIVLLPFLMLLYGAGAALVRELARRSGRGWPTMVTLALAYAVIEESFATQSWFNPDFEGHRLLDYGYVPSMGTSPTWVIFVLLLHVAWSICTPIALTEAIFNKRRLEPWLGRTGICVVGGIFVLGVALLMVHFIGKNHFVASPTQFLISGVAVTCLVIAAFVLFPARLPSAHQTEPLPISKSIEPAPRPWVLGATSFIAGSSFCMIQELAPKTGFPAWLTTTLSLSIGIGMAGYISRSSKRSGWSDRHRFALACGAVLVYCWFGFVVEADIYETAALSERMLFVLLTLIFLFQRVSD
jgi:hypothetical protein